MEAKRPQTSTLAYISVTVLVALGIILSNPSVNTVKLRQDNPNQMGIYCPCFFTLLPEFSQTRVYQTSFLDVRKINFIFIFT